MATDNLKESPRIRQIRREEKKWQKDYDKHQKKIQEMRPTITAKDRNDSYDYLHLQLRLKKLQMEEDRFATIDYENRKLLERIMRVVGENHIEGGKSPQKPQVSPKRRARKVETERIEKENQLIQGRIDRARPLTFSAPSVPQLIRETRERERQNEERKMMEQNRALKERIDAARHRLNLTPPSMSNPHTTFEERYKHEARSIEKQNMELQERLDQINKGHPNYESHEPEYEIRSARPEWQRHLSQDNRAMEARLKNIKSTINPRSKDNDPEYEIRSSRTRPEWQRSLSEDNRAMETRLQNIKSIVNTRNRDNELRSPRHQRNPKIADEEKIIEENKEMEIRLKNIMGRKKSKSRGPDWNVSRQQKFGSLQKSIDQENKILYERLKNVKPVMNTRRKTQVANTEQYVDHFYDENKHLRRRIAKIMKGENPGPLKDDAFLHPKSESPEEGDTPEQEENETKGEKVEEKKDKKKKKTKEYIVPDGYHKKFRKTTKKKNGEDDSDSEYETDSGEE